MAKLTKTEKIRNSLPVLTICLTNFTPKEGLEQRKILLFHYSILQYIWRST